MKRCIHSAFSLFALLLAVSVTATAQIVISGSKCVVPGTVYQYVISGQQDSTATMQIQLAGGRLADTSKGKLSSFSGKAVKRVLVVWSDSGAGNRNLSLSSTGTNSSLDVTF